MDQTNWKKLYPGEPVLVPALKAGALSGEIAFDFL